jgi:hypothetical protein
LDDVFVDGVGGISSNEEAWGKSILRLLIFLYFVICSLDDLTRARQAAGSNDKSIE